MTTGPTSTRRRRAGITRLLPALVAAVVLAGAGAGCGDDEGGDPTPPAPPAVSTPTEPSATAPPPATSPPAQSPSTPAGADEYLARANAYCAEYEEGRDRIQGEGVEQLEEGLPLAERYVSQFESLTPPPALQDAHDRYLASQQGVVQILRDLLAGVQAGRTEDELEAEIRPRLQTLATQGAEAQRELGLTCER